MFLAAEMKKDAVIPLKIKNENIKRCRNQNFLHFHSTKSSKFNSEREKTIDSFFTKPKNFTNKALTGILNNDLPELRNKFDLKNFI